MGLNNAQIITTKEIDVKFENTSSTIKKDIIGEFIFNLRLLNKERLFGIITRFCDIKHHDDVINITCRDVASHNEINKAENIEILNTIVKQIQNNLSFKIKYIEKETNNSNVVDILKKEFKNILKIKEN